MTPHVRWLLVLLLAPMVLSAAPSFAIDVGCGDVVPRGEVGELVSDLTCTGPAIVLEHGATLRMNGHVLTGPNAGTGACLYPLCGGVWCQGQGCAVEGPGEISGFPIGIWGQHPTRPLAKGKVLATDVVLRGNGIGLLSGKARLTNVIARENTTGLIVERSVLATVELTANAGESLIGFKSSGADVHIHDNLGGVAAALLGSVLWRNATVTGNASEGIRAENGRLKLLDSVATGNVGADLSSPRKPVLIATTCGSSSDQAGGDWNVCTND